MTRKDQPAFGYWLFRRWKNSLIRLTSVLVLLLCGSITLFAGFRSDPDYLIDLWETEQGMPDSSATAIVQTLDGYLWIGTFNGLARFDGVDFTVYDPSNVPELPSAGIVNLHYDAAGRLWVSTLKGLAVRQSGRWVDYRAQRGWTGDYARTFAENAGSSASPASMGRFSGSRTDTWKHCRNLQVRRAGGISGKSIPGAVFGLPRTTSSATGMEGGG